MQEPPVPKKCARLSLVRILKRSLVLLYWSYVGGRTFIVSTLLERALGDAIDEGGGTADDAPLFFGVGTFDDGEL
jgi:hypothetical protein